MQKVPGHTAVVVQEIPGALVAEKIQVPFVETQERMQLRTFVPFVAACHSLERIVDVGVAQTPWRWTSHILTQTRRASTSTNHDFHDSNCCNYYHYNYYYYYCCYWIPLGLKDESCVSIVFVASKTALHSEMSRTRSNSAAIWIRLFSEIVLPCFFLGDVQDSSAQ